MLNSSLTSHLLSTYYILGTAVGPSTVSKKLTFSWGHRQLKTTTENLWCVRKHTVC